MQIIKRNVSVGSYEKNDVIIATNDDHVFSHTEHGSDFIIETGLTLSEEDVSLLIMSDESPINFSAISQLPTFRSLSTKHDNMKLLHRRKYHYNNGIELKTNAQDRKSWL